MHKYVDEAAAQPSAPNNVFQEMINRFLIPKITLYYMALISSIALNDRINGGRP